VRVIASTTRNLAHEAQGGRLGDVPVAVEI
jgi:hypothetical protein